MLSSDRSGNASSTSIVRSVSHDFERSLRSIIVEIHQGIVDQKGKRLPLAHEFFERGQF